MQATVHILNKFLPRKICLSLRRHPSVVPGHSSSVVCKGPHKLIFSQRVILASPEGLGKTRATGFV